MIRATLMSLTLVVASATTASAQWYPGQQNGGNRPVQTQGVITSFNWYDLQLQTGNGRTAYVRLHQGTIINPRGTQLQNGMPVRVIGYLDNSGALQANEVDVTNNANCGRNSGYYGNGRYGNGRSNGNGGNGQCRGRWHRGGDRDERGDNEDRGDRENSAYPNPYQTEPPRGW
ncbi:MAG: hypothetical protein M3N13_10010 [Candidatus Eremiobacteraeota bacterium]|nr:hypothetical protein [Candidatus Eremiobacteraeota bacterium]